MTKLHRKLRHQALSQTSITHSEETDEVYSRAYLQAQPKAYPEALPSNLYVGDGRCPHPSTYVYDGECGLCFLQFAFQGELPGQIHHSKTLTTNGNPQQTDKFQSHVQVMEGLEPPKSGQSLSAYRRSREGKSKPADGMFPITSALWKLMGYQPPLARPLILSVSGYTVPQIAQELDISVYNVHERMTKAVRLTLQWIKL